MAAPALIAVGAGMQIAGNIKSNSDQADAERKNAEYYLEQAKTAEYAAQRAERIFRDESDQVLGAQMSAFADAGVDFSGSALLVALDTQRKSRDEIEAIREEGRANVRLAMLRRQNSLDNAENLTSFWNNFLPAAGTAASAAGTYISRKS